MSDLPELISRYQEALEALCELRAAGVVSEDVVRTIAEVNAEIWLENTRLQAKLDDLADPPAVSDSWELLGVEGALKEAESTQQRWTCPKCGGWELGTEESNAGHIANCGGLNRDADGEPWQWAPSVRVGSIDLCIKHGYRGTSEQSGCPECAAAGDGGFFMGIGAGSQIRGYSAVPPDLTEPYRTFILTGVTEPPANDFDDTTEPSAPTKRSDEPVPAWLSSEAPEATSKACGCFTASGVTLQCLACAKGGGR